MNVLIAYLHETYNFLSKEINKLDIKDLEKNYKKILILMFPILPHLVSECLKEIQSDNDDVSWPLAQNEYLEDKYVNIVIQINGKKRAILNTKKGTTEKILLESAKKDRNISKYLENKQINKIIFVQDRLINILINE